MTKSHTLRSYELFIWMMTGNRFVVEFDVRPLEITVRGGYVS